MVVMVVVQERLVVEDSGTLLCPNQERTRTFQFSHHCCEQPPARICGCPVQTTL
jgi:hypothetical protein